MPSAIQALIDETPLFHPAQWGSDPNLLRWLEENLRPGSVTLETGSGHSTAAILALGATHTAIAPAEAERDNIVRWCATHGVPVDRLTFMTERSQDVLPKMNLEPLDLVLIDGWHAFPVPFIDWYYTAPALKVGGVMVVDDTQIRPVRYLTDYMAADRSRWEKLAQVGNTACFRKLVAEVTDTGEWYSHPHSRAEILSPAQRARKAAGAVRRRLVRSSRDVP